MIFTCKWFRGLLVLGLAAPLLLGVSQQLAAQEPPAEEQTAEEAAKKAEEEGLVRLAEEVTVTGSLIPRKDLESLSPVSVLDPEEITYQGTTRIEDLITALPQAFAGQNSTIANGATGTATVNLRHMGQARTLVLMNGRRLPAGDWSNTAVDLNFIPSALVQRVDVLTGGASSVYGADAVTGVVNFVLDTNFEGVRGGIRWNGFQHNNRNTVAQEINTRAGFDFPSGNIFDGSGFNANLAVGGKFAEGKGHAVAYVDFRDVSAVVKSERDYFACTVNRGSTGPQCGGSSTWQYGRFLAFTESYSRTGDYVLDPNTGNTDTFRNRSGDVFNYGPFNHIQAPDRKYSGGGFATYNVNDHFEAYTEIMFMDDYTDRQIAPTGNFGRSTQVNCDNPMLSPSQFDALCTQSGYGPNDLANVTIYRRNVEGGPRTNQTRHASWRLLGGFRGEINDSWSWDVYGLHAQVNNPEGYINDISRPRLREALLVTGDRNDPSSWRCSSGNPNCVPWNLFTNLGSQVPVDNVADGVTQAALDYIAVNAVMMSGTDTQQVVATLTGDLESAGLMLPSASEGVQIAFGGEYRKEHLYTNPDEAYSTGSPSGFGGATEAVDGGFNVKEFFMEALVPLVQDTTGAQDLSLELGYRLASYNLSGTNHSYKAQLSWAPTSSYRFRAGYNKAVRAPNARELFIPTRYGLGGNEDICANDPATGVPAATFEQCARTGVTAAQYGQVLANPAQQYNTLFGGNPDLEVENANTLTFGLVWTPEAITGLTATIDYYDIKVDNTIGTLDADDIINTCANTGDADLCALIHRDRAGTLWLTEEAFTETNFQNIGELRGKGIDISAAYPWNLGDHGFVNISLMGTYLMMNNFLNPLTEYDCAGFFGAQCGQPDAKWRHRARASWNTSFKTTISLGWRYIGSTKIDDASDDEDLSNPGLVPTWELNDIAELPVYNYIDLSANYRFTDNINLTAGCNNLLDKDPPLAPSISSNGFTGTYDVMGRAIYTALRFDF